MQNQRRLKTITVKVPVGLLAKLDEFMKKEGFSNRSEVLRRAIREFLKAKSK